jgi:hypothetical protein
MALACVLALLSGIGHSAAQAGDTKPLKGWSYQVTRDYLADLPEDPYLQEIMEQLGPPSYALEATAIQYNNVAGKCQEFIVEIGYVGVDATTGRLVNHFYTTSIIVAPNGDTLEAVGAGVSQLEDDPLTFEYSGMILGGTGRGEGAWGFTQGAGTGPFPYPSTFEGVISTVGSVMSER